MLAQTIRIDVVVVTYFLYALSDFEVRVGKSLRVVAVAMPCTHGSLDLIVVLLCRIVRYVACDVA